MIHEASCKQDRQDLLDPSLDKIYREVSRSDFRLHAILHGGLEQRNTGIERGQGIVDGFQIGPNEAGASPSSVSTEKITVGAVGNLVDGSIGAHHAKRIYRLNEPSKRRFKDFLARHIINRRVRNLSISLMGIDREMLDEHLGASVHYRFGFSSS